MMHNFQTRVDPKWLSKIRGSNLFKLTKINSNHADVRRHTFLEKSCCTVSLYLLMFENVPVSVNIFLNGSHNIVYK